MNEIHRTAADWHLHGSDFKTRGSLTLAALPKNATDRTMHDGWQSWMS